MIQALIKANFAIPVFPCVRKTKKWMLCVYFKDEGAIDHAELYLVTHWTTEWFTNKEKPSLPDTFLIYSKQRYTINFNKEGMFVIDEGEDWTKTIDFEEGFIYLGDSKKELIEFLENASEMLL